MWHLRSLLIMYWYSYLRHVKQCNNVTFEMFAYSYSKCTCLCLCFVLYYRPKVDEGKPDVIHSREQKGKTKVRDYSPNNKQCMIPSTIRLLILTKQQYSLLNTTILKETQTTSNQTPSFSLILQYSSLNTSIPQQTQAFSAEPQHHPTPTFYAEKLLSCVWWLNSHLWCLFLVFPLFLGDHPYYSHCSFTLHTLLCCFLLKRMSLISDFLENKERKPPLQVR